MQILRFGPFLRSRDGPVMDPQMRTFGIGVRVVALHRRSAGLTHSDHRRRVCAGIPWYRMN